MTVGDTTALSVQITRNLVIVSTTAQRATLLLSMREETTRNYWAGPREEVPLGDKRGNFSLPTRNVSIFKDKISRWDQTESLLSVCTFCHLEA